MGRRRHGTRSMDLVARSDRRRDCCQPRVRLRVHRPAARVERLRRHGQRPGGDGRQRRHAAGARAVERAGDHRPRPRRRRRRGDHPDGQLGRRSAAGGECVPLLADRHAQLRADRARGAWRLRRDRGGQRAGAVHPDDRDPRGRRADRRHPRRARDQRGVHRPRRPVDHLRAAPGHGPVRRRVERGHRQGGRQLRGPRGDRRGAQRRTARRQARRAGLPDDHGGERPRVGRRRVRRRPAGVARGNRWLTSIRSTRRSPRCW